MGNLKSHDARYYLIFYRVRLVAGPKTLNLPAVVRFHHSVPFMSELKYTPVSGKVTKEFLDHLNNDIDYSNGWPKDAYEVAYGKPEKDESTKE